MKRAYVDTNVIVRFLTRTPPDLAAQTKALFEAIERGEMELIIDEIILAETVWVLKSFYDFSASEIARVLQDLLSHTGIHAVEKDSSLTALSLFADKNIDFVDALLAVHMAKQGDKEVYSFDTHFDRIKGITRLVPG
jgi:predicted nucleic acid-binding protein